MTTTHRTGSSAIGALDRTVFVEAGAGSGKTSCLVDRFVALVESGVPADRIAAITFTTKAANELGERIRAALEEGARDGSQLCLAGLAALDRSAICTVHSFAQRILTEHPIEAGLPPRVDVIDEIAAAVQFEARWEDYVDRLLTDAEMERPVRLLLASGGTIEKLHSVAVEFNENWDLVSERAGSTAVWATDCDVSEILAGLTRVATIGQQCTSAEDKLLSHIAGTVREFEQSLAQAADDDLKLELLVNAKLKCRFGQKGNWPDVGVGAVRDLLVALQEACQALSRAVQDNTLQALASSLAAFTLSGADKRRAAGALEYHDLLVLARLLLRDPVHGPTVRAALATRYERLLIDEFQDTDPIQVELALLIASNDPDAGRKDWREIMPQPGHLFFVGDPKQAIYRFRRADIATFLDTRDCVVGDAETLDCNYRTSRTILDWVNKTFSELIEETAGCQPKYTPLDPFRDDPGTGPAVSFIGREHEGKPRAQQLRDAEARDVAKAVQLAMQDRWSVSERLPDGSERWRPTRWSDIAILLPTRNSLSELQPALESADIPYRVETSTLVYETREVRDLMLIAHAVDDPTDSLSVVAALRTPAFACGDDDLLAWRRRGGRSWDYALPNNGSPPSHPVAAGLERLRMFHELRMWMSPSELLDSILRECRFFELGVAARRPRDLWRRLRFVLDQCRAWEEAGGTTFRHYLHWISGQSVKGARAKETVLPETDDDAVRILTVHGAKGLEFPIVVLSGLTSELVQTPRGVQVRFPDTNGWAIQLSKDLATADFADTVALEEQMERAERIRLLYVATTRARDHLVVSVHRKAADGSVVTGAEVLFTAGWDERLVDPLPLDDEGLTLASDRHTKPPTSALPTLEDWRLMRDAALLKAARPVAVSASGLAAGEEPATGSFNRVLMRQQGASRGAAVGRAVHAVMQSVDLATGDMLTERCKAQAAIEGIPGQESLIESLCRSALDSDVVRLAAQARHWREVYVGVPESEGVLEGFIDLLYEDGEGLSIVDYKTDAWRDETDLQDKVDRYRVQMQAYSRAVRETVGKEITGTTLLFLSRDGQAARSVQV